MYKDFINNERILSDKFLKSEQIFINKFDESEYLLIEKIFKDEDLINKIYEVIDKIILQEKIEWNYRFLFIGDFLFSITSLDIKDPYNIILKTSRNDYINKILIRAEINSIFNCDFNKYIKIHKKLLVGLRKYEIIERYIIKILKDDWETIIYFRLKASIKNVEDIINIGISENPFYISFNKRYLIGSFRNILKLKRKKKEMEDFKVCIMSVIKSNAIKFKLDEKLYIINKELIEKEAIKLLNKVDCSSLEEYFKRIKEELLNKKYDPKIFKESYYEIKMNEKDKYYELMKIYQKIISISILNRKIFNKSIYLPCFFDNRGRQYYGSLISPTFYKIFRNIYKFEEEKKFKEFENSKFYKKIMEYKYIIDSLNLSEIDSYMALVLLMEIGKFYLKKEEYLIKTEEFIKRGLENYDKEDEILKFEDRLYLNKIKENLKKIIKRDKYDINTIIFKDATASGLQNYGIILGYKEEKIKYLNLDGEEWCDTYKYVIDKFLESNKFSKRKYWKSTIMTIPYNAEWFSCFIKFTKALEEDDINYNKMEEEEKSKLRELHKKMYYDIKNKLKEDLFIKKEGKLINFKYNEWKVVNKKEYKINFEKLRDKYVDTTYIIIDDEKTSKRALEANNMHYLDAILIKKIMEELEIIPIHDCFGIRLCELHMLIDRVNKYYSEKIGRETYCIHVLK